VPKSSLVSAAFVAGLVLLPALTGGCDSKPPNAPPAGAPTTPTLKPPAPSGSPPPADVGPPLIMTAEAYVADFKKDKSSAARYQGKTIEITGTIHEFLFNSDDIATFIIEVAKGTLHCWSRNHEVWKEALPGQTVTLRGKPYSDVSPYLDHCTVVKVAGKRPPSLTTTELVKDPPDRKAVERYGHVVFTGKIEGLEEESVDPSGDTCLVKAKLVFTPKGSKRPAYGRLQQWFKGTTSPLKVGSTVTVLGKLIHEDTETELVSPTVLEMR
jgi:hypothetical protein